MDTSRDFAVVFGINSYQKLTPLKGPRNDAEDFQQWLLSDALVPPANILPIPPIEDAIAGIPTGHPGPDELDEPFVNLASQVRASGSLRRLYIFLAGHGWSPTTTGAALLAANAATGVFGRHLFAGNVVEWFSQACGFEEILLFMDCCRDIVPNATVRPFPADRMQAFGSTPKYVAGLACDWSSKSREAPFPDPSGPWRGRFSTVLMSGLRGAARDPQTGVLTGRSLEAYVLREMEQQQTEIAQADSLAPLQKPRFTFTGDIDILPAPATPITAAVELTLLGSPLVAPLQILQGTDFTTMATLAPGTNHWQGQLPPGRYLITPVPRGIQVFNVNGNEPLQISVTL